MLLAFLLGFGPVCLPVFSAVYGAENSEGRGGFKDDLEEPAEDHSAEPKNPNNMDRDADPLRSLDNRDTLLEEKIQEQKDSQRDNRPDPNAGGHAPTPQKDSDENR